MDDAAAIRAVLQRYALAIDTRDFDALGDVFETDARLDHSSTGGPADTFDAVLVWLRASLVEGLISVHHLTTSSIEVDGDAATSVTYVDNPLAGADGRVFVRFDGIYHDRWRRTPAGWRISERRLDISAYTGDLTGVDIRIGPPGGSA